MTAVARADGWPTGSTIHVVVPAAESSLRLLRVTAATAAADLATGIDRVDDVRLAIDELAASAIAVAPRGHPLHVTIDVDGRELSVRGRVHADGAGPPRLSEVGAVLVSSICRDHQLGRDGDDVVFRFHMDLGRPVGRGPTA